jgi:predicted anti-sigma-YlaC factor YlaD
MKNCEDFEILVSTWLDGPLDRSDQMKCLDHLVRCEGCRTFYVDARALDGLVSAVRTPADAASPSPEMWKRIDWMTRAGEKRVSVRRVPAWALRAAAGVVVAVGLTVAMWIGDPFAPPPEQAEILLGQGAEMTDTRFVELTREVLESEPRYRSAMFQIMEQVVRDTAPARESSSEGLLQRSDEGEGGEGVESPGHQPA